MNDSSSSVGVAGGARQARKIRYSLAWNPNPPLTAAQIAAIAVAAGVYVILSWVGVIALPTGFFSVSALFVAVGFGIPFALWFGGWGFVIGFLGGLGGVIIGWLAGQALNVIAIVYLAGQAGQQGGPPPSVAVYTPYWLPLFALIFSTIIGMISGLYPALRAATMIPVLALKYE